MIHVEDAAILVGHDTVICGPGDDTVYVDRSDVVVADCERVIRVTTR